MKCRAQMDSSALFICAAVSLGVLSAIFGVLLMAKLIGTVAGGSQGGGGIADDVLCGGMKLACSNP
jgi:hypothetical protein